MGLRLAASLERGDDPNALPRAQQIRVCGPCRALSVLSRSIGAVTGDDARLRAAIEAVPIIDFSGAPLDDGQGGQVVIQPLPNGSWDVVIMRKPGQTAEAAAVFDAWARERVFMALTVGPEVDGWFRRQSDNGWQITARSVEMPADPFL